MITGYVTVTIRNSDGEVVWTGVAHGDDVVIQNSILRPSTCTIRGPMQDLSGYLQNRKHLEKARIAAEDGRTSEVLSILDDLLAGPA